MTSPYQLSGEVLGHRGKGMTFVFYVSRPTFFENQCGSAEKTNKPPKNKHGTSQRKLMRNVMVKKRSPEVPLIDDTIDEKLLISRI